MSELEPRNPLVDNGKGFATSESVSSALAACGLEELAGISVTFKDQRGSIEYLLTRCPIEHLTKDYPRKFTQYVLMIASNAAS